jgi:RNA polymerase sigma factor (sigma-70 family)
MLRHGRPSPSGKIESSQIIVAKRSGCQTSTIPRWRCSTASRRPARAASTNTLSISSSRGAARNLAFNRIVVVGYRMYLESRGLAANTINQQLATWLYRLAVNMVLMKRRRHKSPPMLSLDAPVSSDPPSLQHELGRRDPNLSCAIDSISLHRAIEALPSGYRKIFGLFEVHGYQHREIAELLHCSMNTSKSQLHHARLKLWRLLFPKRSSARLRDAHASRTKAARWRR